MKKNKIRARRLFSQEYIRCLWLIRLISICNHVYFYRNLLCSFFSLANDKLEPLILEALLLLFFVFHLEETGFLRAKMSNYVFSAEKKIVVGTTIRPQLCNVFSILASIYDSFKANCQVGHWLNWIRQFIFMIITFETETLCTSLNWLFCAIHILNEIEREREQRTFDSFYGDNFSASFFYF